MLSLNEVSVGQKIFVLYHRARTTQSDKQTEETLDKPTDTCNGQNTRTIATVERPEGAVQCIVASIQLDILLPYDCCRLQYPLQRRAVKCYALPSISNLHFLFLTYGHSGAQG